MRPQLEANVDFVSARALDEGLGAYAPPVFDPRHSRELSLPVSEDVPHHAPDGVDALTTDDTILAGFAAQPEYAGKFKVVGKPFSEENYGVGLKKGDTATCEKVNAAISKMVADGSWQKALDANLGPAGYKPGAGNPPTPAACS